ncbi:MAG: hypothetical protein ACK5KL_20405 [Dysgonomonas sp.]
MAINKTAKNMEVKINNSYLSTSKSLKKEAEYMEVEATVENLTLVSNKKIQTLGDEIGKSSKEKKQKLPFAISKVVATFINNLLVEKNEVKDIDTLIVEPTVFLEKVNIMGVIRGNDIATQNIEEIRVGKVRINNYWINESNIYFLPPSKIANREISDLYINGIEYSIKNLLSEFEGVDDLIQSLIIQRSILEEFYNTWFEKNQNRKGIILDQIRYDGYWRLEQAIETLVESYKTPEDDRKIADYLNNNEI